MLVLEYRIYLEKHAQYAGTKIIVEMNVDNRLYKKLQKCKVFTPPPSPEDNT